MNILLIIALIVILLKYGNTPENFYPWDEECEKKPIPENLKNCKQLECLPGIVETKNGFSRGGVNWRCGDK